MTLSTFFKSLGAPFVNARWSWGAVRPEDGALFLRVWEDEVRRIDNTQWVRVAANAQYAGSNDDGWLERLAHLDRIRGGAKCFLVFVAAKDKNAMPRGVKSFLDDAVIEGTKIAEFDGDTRIQLGRRIPAQQQMPATV
ncbi:MAG TPA: hypothetical protein VGG30_01700 [Pirellulales bacterium]|jgi:hypothetical protein